MLRKISWIASMIAVVLLTGCQTTPKTEEGKEALANLAQATLGQFKAADPGMEQFLSKAHGVAVFPEIGKGGLIIGGAYGRGVVYEQGKMIGYADMQQASIGLQAGGQSYAQVIAFENQASLDRFKSNQFEFSANASAVIIQSGVAAAAKYVDGVAILVKPLGGAMAEASVGGQRFTFVASGQ